MLLTVTPWEGTQGAGGPDGMLQAPWVAARAAGSGAPPGPKPALPHLEP